ncbi:MAG: TfoX/Sxy family protein [Bacillota bacterium]|nr:TfoX/Sxy family protein [Bacillota bacterium]
MDQLGKLPNIGKEALKQLNEVGITTFEQLKEIGSKEAWIRVLEIDSSACINRLYGFEGAIRGVKKTMLPSDVKTELKSFYNEIKGK